MQVTELKSISKAEGYIYYINKYTATAVIEFLSKQLSFPFSFTIEVSPLGVKTLTLANIPQDLEYPLVPVRIALKEYILKLENANQLP